MYEYSCFKQNSFELYLYFFDLKLTLLPIHHFHTNIQILILSSTNFLYDPSEEIFLVFDHKHQLLSIPRTIKPLHDLQEAVINKL